MANWSRKKVFKLAKGFTGRSKNCFGLALRKVFKKLTYAYRDRKVKKRDFRSLWIQRINAASRSHGLPYSKFMNGLKKANITLDRKQLSEIAIHDDAVFATLVKKSMAALSK